MNREWFKNRANQKFKESIDLLNKVRDNIQYIKDVKNAYGYELDTLIFKGTFFILDEIDININKSLELVKTNSIEGGTHETIAQKVIIDGFSVYCPVCTELIADTYLWGVNYVHKCPYCNQKLNWKIESDLIGGNVNDL
jgi:hypothetical protein